MRWSRGYVDLLLRFAARGAAIHDMRVDEALLSFTPLYLNLGLGWPFNPDHPTWHAFIAGCRTAPERTTWVHSFYLAHARTYGESRYGCFSYAYEPDTRTIKLHFGNRYPSGIGPLSKEREQTRRNELAAMFADIRRDVPGAGAVRGRSWLYNLDAYIRLFPPEYVRTATPDCPGFQFMSLWGQFLDRHGEARPGPTAVFLDRIAAATTDETLTGSVPLPVRAPRCAIEHFYAYYGLE